VTKKVTVPDTVVVTHVEQPEGLGVKKPRFWRHGASAASADSWAPPHGAWLACGAGTRATLPHSSMPPAPLASRGEHETQSVSLSFGGVGSVTSMAVRSHG